MGNDMLSKKLICAVVTFGIASLGLAQVDRNTLVMRLTNGNARTWTLQKKDLNIRPLEFTVNDQLVLRIDGGASSTEGNAQKQAPINWMLKQMPGANDWVLVLKRPEDVRGYPYLVNVLVGSAGKLDRLVLSKPLAPRKGERSLTLQWTSPKK